MTETDGPGHYEFLDFNAPLSGARADALARDLAGHRPRTVLDVGCGWGELLMRTVAEAPDSTGLGVDSDEPALARGRANATARGLDGRVRFEAGDCAAARTAADCVICIGADHAFGDQAAALGALGDLVRPGGRLLFGSGFWTHPPSLEQAAAVGMTPGSLTDLAGLVELAVQHGWRPLRIQTAGRDEWEQFESGYLADWEEWLVAHPGHPDADDVRSRADRHRDEWLRGYSGVLGFAYLTLGPARPDSAS